MFCFKNWEEFSCKLDSDMVCFLGENGTGKTNFLDAIYYLCTTKSYFNAADSLHVTHGHEQASILGEFNREGLGEQIICTLKRGHKKVVKRNFKEYDKLADHIGLLPVVMITPYDIELVWEGSLERRKFMDGALSQMDKSYLQQWATYNHALLQRNTILHSQGLSLSAVQDQIEPWNHVLSGLTSSMHIERLKWSLEISSRLQMFYEAIAGRSEVAEVVYDSDVSGLNDVNMLWQDVAADYHAGRTRKGLHRDELHFNFNGRPLKKFGSQGQQKSFLFALKLAQLSLMQDKIGYTPLLLLDDIFDKIDEGRITRILSLLKDSFRGQVFITDTSKSRLTGLMKTVGIIPQVIFTSET